MLDLKGYGWMLWGGVQITLAVAICAMGLALVLGFQIPLNFRLPYLAVSRVDFWRRWHISLSTWLRDYLYENFGIDIILDINPFLAGFITLGFIYGAFATEVFRGAYLAVPKGQIEAAKAIGMSRMLIAWRILLPQMWRFALPGLGNVWMVLIKATALISVIQLPELLRNSDIAARAVRMPFTFYFAASLIYLAIAIASMWAQERAEAWASRGVRQA